MNGLQDYTLSDRFFEELREMPKFSATQQAKWKHKRGHKEQNYRVTTSRPGESLVKGGQEAPDLSFDIYVRQSVMLESNFSCGIRFQGLTLARYNGPHRTHKNGAGHKYPIIVKTCHIHRATEKALSQGKNAEFYATPTDEYDDVKGAFACLLDDFNVSGIIIVV